MVSELFGLLGTVGEAVLKECQRTEMFPRKCPEVAVDQNLKWPEDVLLATVSLKGLCKHIRGHTCVRGHFGVWLMSV